MEIASKKDLPTVLILLNHSIFSDPELSEIEIDLHQKIIAA
jgi:hypothetical protein